MRVKKKKTTHKVRKNHLLQICPPMKMSMTRRKKTYQYRRPLRFHQIVKILQTKRKKKKTSFQTRNLMMTLTSGKKKHPIPPRLQFQQKYLLLMSKEKKTTNQSKSRKKNKM